MPGDRVRGVLGQPAGEVLDVAANAILVSYEGRRWWLDSNVVLLVRGGTVVLKCPAKFTSQYRVPSARGELRRSAEARSTHLKG
jgi:hypothetical protein